MNILTPALAPSSTIPPAPDRVDGISTSDAISAGDAFFAMVEVATSALPDAALALPKVAPIVVDPLAEPSVEALLNADRVVPGIDPALFFSGDGRRSGADDLAANLPHSAPVPLPSAKKVAHLTGNAPPTPDVTAKAASPTFLAGPDEPAPSMDAAPSDRALADHLGAAAPDPAFIAAMPLLAAAIPQSAGLPPQAEQTHAPRDLEPDAPKDIALGRPVPVPPSHADQLQPELHSSPNSYAPDDGIATARPPARSARSADLPSEIPALRDSAEPAKAFASTDMSPFRARLDPEFWQVQPLSPSITPPVSAPPSQIPQPLGAIATTEPATATTPVNPAVPDVSTLSASLTAPQDLFATQQGQVTIPKTGNPPHFSAENTALAQPMNPATSQDPIPAKDLPIHALITQGQNRKSPVRPAPPVPTGDHLAGPAISVDSKPENPHNAALQFSSQRPLPTAAQPGPVSPDLGGKPATSPQPPDLRAPPPAAAITGSDPALNIVPINPPVMPLRQEPSEPPAITVDPRRPQTKAGSLQTSLAPLPDLPQRPAWPTVAAATVRLTDPPPAGGQGPFAAATASGPALPNPAAAPDDAQQQPSDPQPRRETSHLPTASGPPPPPHQSAPGILIRLDAAEKTVPDARAQQAISTRWPSPQPVRHGSLPRPGMIQSDLPLAAPTRQPALVAPRSTDAPTLSRSPAPSGLDAALIFPRQTPQAGLVKPGSAASAILPTVQVPGLPPVREGLSRNQPLSDTAFLRMREAALTGSAQTHPALTHQRARLSQPGKHDGAPQPRFLTPDVPIDPSHAAPRKDGNSNGPALPTAPVAGFHFEPAATIPVAPATAAVAAGPQTDRRPAPPPFVAMRGQVRLEPVAADRTPLPDLPPRALKPPITVPKPAPDFRPQAEASPFVTAHPEAVAKTPQFPAPATQTLTTAPAAKDRSRPFRATDHLQINAPKAAPAEPSVAKPRRATTLESNHGIEPMPPARTDDAPQTPRPDSTTLPPPHQPSHGPSVQSAAPDRPPPPPANPENRVLPHALPHALAKAASHARTDDRVEMTLDPVELGKVRFEFSTISDRMQVNLVVERPETLDLLRRNADALRAEFRDAGFDGASLTFSHWGQGRRDDQPAPVARFDSFSADTAPATPLPTRTRTATGQGLDLRL